MSTQPAVETIELTKKYDSFIAVDKLSLRIEKGEVFGFLGPNGAGKTTTILMLLGLTEPTSGSARVFGYNSTREPLKVKRIVGYMPEKVGFYEDLTARQNLKYTARLNGVPETEITGRINQVLELVGLSDAADRMVREFSRGMKQRLGIADVLIKEPEVVILDEPTAGIDPKGIDQVLSIIKGMAKKGITIILCSHQLPQVQKVCTRVGILAEGRLVAEGSVDRLGREAVAGGRFRVDVQVAEPNAKLVKSLRQIKGVLNVEESGNLLVVSCNADLRPQIAKAIVEAGGSLIEMKIEEFGLEEIYRKYFREG